MSIETVVAIVVPLIALVFTALSYRRNQNQDTTATATERATMSADVRYIRTSIDEIKVENKAIQRDLGDLKTKIVEVEASAKMAHRRLDDLQKG